VCVRACAHTDAVKDTEIVANEILSSINDIDLLFILEQPKFPSLLAALDDVIGDLLAEQNNISLSSHHISELFFRDSVIVFPQESSTDHWYAYARLR
jgi:hypothetical protein